MGCATQSNPISYDDIKISRDTLPDLTFEQVVVVRHTRPTIDHYLYNPNEWYVWAVEKQNEQWVIKIGKIVELQQRYSIQLPGQEEGVYGGPVDGEDDARGFVFDQNYNLITCSTNWHNECTKLW
jgi:hypothetical protein